MAPSIAGNWFNPKFSGRVAFIFTSSVLDGLRSNLAYAESLPTGTHFGRPRCFTLAWQSGRDAKSL
jgi:hypothetical protein